MIEWYDATAFTPPTTEDVLICTEDSTGHRNVTKAYYTEGQWVRHGSATVIAWAFINYPEQKED